MEFPRQEYWSGLPFPSPRRRFNPDPGIKPVSPAWQADSLPSEPPRKPISTIENEKYVEMRTPKMS